MSTAAHEPRRAGSPSGSKVTPRRNAPETGETNGMRYDSDELPVLIRLPDLLDLSPVEKPTTSRPKMERPPIDRARLGKQNAAKGSKKSIPLQVGHNKLVLSGIVAGVLVVIVLFLLNAGGSKPPTDQDGWASEADQLETLVQEPEFSVTMENEPPPLYPGFANEAPETETAQFASGEFEGAPGDVPFGHEPQATRQSQTAALPNKQEPVGSWPSEEAMGLQSASGVTPTNHWPSDSLSLEQSGNEYSPADSPSQTDFRSSMYPAETESFRMGKLNSDRPLASESDRSSILDGIIETPDTRALR